jgi:DHA1 family tetracycline resistance protein-like MFS transporter
MTDERMPDTAGGDVAPRWQMWPLYGAGFVTAFGAHSIAANLGGFIGPQHLSLFTLGALLAVYDGAEVLLKPVFGSLADWIGPRPVLLGGLLAFAVASSVFVIAGDPGAIWAARLAQGAAAAAFSPAAGAMIGRLSPRKGHGRAFGGYGAWKGLGYALGPVLGGVLITTSGYGLLFSVLALMAIIVLGWTVLAVPSVPPLPRPRQTVLDLARQLSAGSFLRPTLTLAGTTAALSVGVGFLPVIGAAHHYGPLATGAAVSVLAATAALVQPRAGRAADAGRITARTGMAAGLAIAAGGFTIAAVAPNLVGILVAAVAIGVGTGAATPLAFASLAGVTPPERMGQTMGAAEVGRELGDAGGPLLVGVIAAAVTLPLGLVGLAVLLAAIAAVVLLARSHQSTSRH